MRRHIGAVGVNGPIEASTTGETRGWIGDVRAYLRVDDDAWGWLGDDSDGPAVV